MVGAEPGPPPGAPRRRRRADATRAGLPAAGGHGGPMLHNPGTLRAASQLEARLPDGSAIHRRPCPGRSTLPGLFHVRGRRLSPSGLPAIRRSSSRRSTLVTEVSTKPSVTHDPRYHPAADRGVMPLAEPGVASLAMDAAIGSRHDREREMAKRFLTRIMSQGSAPLAEPGAASVAMDAAIGSRHGREKWPKSPPPG